MKLFLMGFLIILNIAVFGAEKPIEVTSFYYPPYMGKSAISENGLLFDLVIAAFNSVDVSVIPNLIPVKRGIYQIKMNETLAYIGILDTFDSEIIKEMEVYPLVNIDFLLFYLKEKFPNGIIFDNYSDLKPYKISVLAGGVTEVFMKRNNLKFSSVKNFDSIFEKVKTKHTDMGVAVDISIDLWLEKLFKGEKNKFKVINEKPFLSRSSVIILNKKHPDYAKYKVKLEKGLKNIVKNGQYKKILEKYYGKGKVNKKETMVIENTVKSFK